MSVREVPAADHPRPDPTAVAELARFSVATLHEAIGKRGALPPRIKPLDREMRLSGPALPVSCPAGDNLMLHVAIAAARPGDVLVIDNEGSTEFGPFGDVLATACRARGIAGVVIDGSVRDASSLRAMRFPVFCRGLSIIGTTKTGGGSVGAWIKLGATLINPGDIILGDEDGCVVVPLAEAATAAAAAAERQMSETLLCRALDQNKTTLELLALWQD